MSKKSAGILLYRVIKDALEILLVHPGGPFWKKKDLGAWSIPKGEFTDEEDPLKAALRELEEETGLKLSSTKTIPLTPVKQKGGKEIFAWAIEGNIDPAEVRSNTFEMEWPPKSGKKQSFPEIDKVEWFSVTAAREKINPAQVDMVEELAIILS